MLFFSATTCVGDLTTGGVSTAELLPRLKVKIRRIAGIIPEMTPGLAALVSGTADAELGVSGLVSGNSAAPKRLLSAAIMLAAGPTARRHVAKSKTRSERKRDITETVE